MVFNMNMMSEVKLHCALLALVLDNINMIS